jgi:hypothetical protein
LVCGSDAGDEPGGGVDGAGVGVGVKRLDDGAQRLHQVLGHDQYPEAGRRLDGVFAGDGFEAPVVVADLEPPAALALHGHQAYLAQVHQVADLDAERLGDPEAHDALQPENHLVHDVQVGGDAGALGQAERPGLAGGAPPSGSGWVGGWCFEALGGVEAGGRQPVGPDEGQHPAQHPQGVGHVGLRQAFGAADPFVGDGGNGAGRDPDDTVGVAVGAGEGAGLPAAPGGGQAHPCRLGQLGQAHLSVTRAAGASYAGPGCLVPADQAE